MNLIRRIFEIGINDSVSESDYKFITLTNVIGLTILIGMIAWIGLAIIYFPQLNLNLIVFCITAVCCLFSFFLNYIQKHIYATTLLLVCYYFAMMAHVIICGTSYGHQLLFIPGTLLTFLFSQKGRFVNYFIAILLAITFVYFECFYPASYHMVVFTSDLAVVMRTLIHLTVYFVVALFAIYLTYVLNQIENKLKIEREKAELLLFNILPKAIAIRLKSDSHEVADSFPTVSILFADLVGFTDFSTGKPPGEVVDVLNLIFSHFDDLLEKYGVEKIKTIGDCYMVASGLPELQDDHAIRITNFALEISAYLQQMRKDSGFPLDMRIGINSGPVVAGVIGKKKFIYDLWGDSVNTASRMESHGIPGRIHVTQATYDLIKDNFRIESRGLIEVKGKGKMQTYIVKEAMFEETF